MSLHCKSRWSAVAALALVSAAAAPAHAEMSAEELAKLAQNPVGNLISVPFQNNTNLNFGPEKGTQNILNIQPVIPISTPLVRSSPGWSAGIEITGRIVRVMMFHSLLTEIGITGWMLRMFCVPFSGPKLRLVLFWNGTLIRLPTGFCASLASSSALISACTGAAETSAIAATADQRDLKQGDMTCSITIEDSLPHSPRRRRRHRAQLRRHLRRRGHCVGEEPLEPRAEIVEARLAIRRAQQAALRAFAPAFCPGGPAGKSFGFCQYRCIDKLAASVYS